ncbi:MAG: substrate-binding domain-containing protein [Dehalococcoidia bacterium]
MAPIQERRIPRLRDLLGQLFISRTELAAALGVSKQTVDSWCVRRTHIRPDHLDALCRHLRDHGAPADHLGTFVADELTSQGLDVGEWLTARTEKDGAEHRPPVYVICWKAGIDSMFGSLAHICREMLDRQTYPAIMLDCCGEHHLRRFYVREAVRRGCSGVVLVGVEGEPPDEDEDLMASCRYLAAAGIPTVFVRGGEQLVPGLPRAAGVYWEGALDAALDTLVGLGHQRVGAFIRGARPPRLDEFQGSLLSHGLGFDPRWLAWNDDGPAVHERVELDLRDIVTSCSAVWCSPTSVGRLLSVCQELAVEVPQDLSIMSSGPSGFFREWAPRLTYVRTPFDRVGREAARLMAQLIDGDGTAEHAVVRFGREHMTVENLENGSVARVYPEGHVVRAAASS